MVVNGSATYTYDAENQIKTAGGVTYVYDGDGKRVNKSLGRLYWYGTGSDSLTETDGSGNILREFVYFNGKRTARIDLPAGTVHYYFADHLRTLSEMASATGTIENDSDYYPYGGERVIKQNVANEHYKFSSKEWDSESGLDEFGARYYASTIGRFMTPDWSRDPDPIAYADYENPQTLNLYQYVENNPLNATDPDGHAHWGPCPQDSNAQCWTGDKNGEVDPENGTIWNSGTQQWDQPPPPPQSDLQLLLNWRRNFINDWNRRIAAHLAPPQKPSNLDPLQLLNNLMIGGMLVKEPLVRDITGKVHGDIPDHVPDDWTHEDLEQAQHELQESVKQRNVEQSKYGEDGGHRERIRREEHLLRQIDKKLSGS